MSYAVRERRRQMEEEYNKIMNTNANPKILSLALEKDEANIPIMDAPWIWDVVVKYFPLAKQDNWVQYYSIVKKAVKICQQRGVHIGVVYITGKMTKREKEWIKNGFFWKVKRYPKVGRLGKLDAKRLQRHRYNVIGGITKGGIRVLKASGYKEEEAKNVFLAGSLARLEKMDLLPQSIAPRKEIEHKKEE